MKTTTSRATRAVLNERGIVARWRGWLATQSTTPAPQSAPDNVWEHGWGDVFYFFNKITRRKLKRQNSLLYIKA